MKIQPERPEGECSTTPAGTRRHVWRLRSSAIAISLALVAVACTSSTAPPPEQPETSQAPTTESAPQTSTTILPEPVGTSAVTTTSLTSDSPSMAAEIYEYAVVAEEQSRRLTIIDAGMVDSSGCLPCELEPLSSIDLPERPHNLTAVGSVVFATHPRAGSMSQVDIARGDVLTAGVGTEPHDVKYSSQAETLFVADEAGRRLLTVDPNTLEILAAVELPAEPHDLAVAGDAVWVTLNGRSELARVAGTDVALFDTAATPHDLIIDPQGVIWFSNWDSHILNTFDPAIGSSAEAPAGVAEPHHFALGPQGEVWVSDNGGSAVVGFGPAGPVTVDVGPVPHHLAFVGDTLVVAVSGSGEAVLVRRGEVIARAELTTGLHGVAVVTLPDPIPAGR